MEVAPITSNRSSVGHKLEKVQPAAPADWVNMYQRSPHGNSTLFELESMVAKRMELLAWIDQKVNAPQAQSFDEVLDAIAARLPQERRSNNTAAPAASTTLGTDDSGRTSTRRSQSRNGAEDSKAPFIVFDEEEDLISHLLCRFAFCMSERWRKWYVKTEEMLLLARMKMESAKGNHTFLADVMARNGLPCAPLSESQKADVRIQEYLVYRRSRVDAAIARDEGKIEGYFSVPASLAIRLIKTRKVLCRGGQAILYRDQVREVFLTVFRSHLNRGLHTAYQARMKQQALEEETSKVTVMRMLDAFLEQFVQDPADNLQEGVAGSVRAGDVQYLSQTHFPLCMRAVDSHLRRDGHLKHHGRFSYGLFLKAIGLTLDDSMALFSTLMTVKGGGSVEAFAKTAYGYNVRHNYGMEGKKTSYSALSCSTTLALPPVVDQHDCHGCPFRFRDEAAFRAMLGKEQHNPRGRDYPDLRPSAGDIEDIIGDCKAQHYTRACYKYFMVTHPDAKRDSLFRSPYEYYTVSQEYGGTDTGADSSRASAVGSKRSTTTLNEDVIRARMSS